MVTGKGKYTYKSPAHTKPATSPSNALKGIRLKGLRTNPSPVATSKPHTSQLQASPRRTTTPVANNRAPTQIPRYPRALRKLPAEPFVRKLSNFETATTPPKIKT